MTTLDYVGCIRSESRAFRDAITTASLDLPVEGCPGWTVRDLAHHLGEVQRWARMAAQFAAPPAPATIDGPPSDAIDEAAGLRAWLADGAEQLCDVLAHVAPDAPTWHPFPVPQVAGVWPRRQAHEVAIHRWDIQRAAAIIPSPFDLAFAVDFVREYFEVVVPRVIDRDARVAPVGRLGVHLTDAGSDLVVLSTGDTVTLEVFDGAPVDAALAGTADEILLALWQRKPLSTAPNSPLASAWLAFGGN